MMPCRRTTVPTSPARNWVRRVIMPYKDARCTGRRQGARPDRSRHSPAGADESRPRSPHIPQVLTGIGRREGRQDVVSTPLNLGFLVVLNDNGYLGGYLVTNAWGRPLEFRLSS